MHSPERRLPAPALADEPDGLTSADVEAHAVDRPNVPRRPAAGPRPGSGSASTTSRTLMTVSPRSVRDAGSGASPTALMPRPCVRHVGAGSTPRSSACSYRKHATRPIRPVGRQRGVEPLAHGRRVRAPAREPAGAAGSISSGTDPSIATSSPRRCVGRRNRADQSARVRVHRLIEHLVGGPDLDESAGIHHRDPVADPSDEREVVADVEHGRVQPFLQLGEQVQDPRLDRDVQGGRRLVGDQQLGVRRQRLRDHHALLHATGELVRIPVHHLAWVRDARVGERPGDPIVDHGLEPTVAPTERRGRRAAGVPAPRRARRGRRDGSARSRRSGSMPASRRISRGSVLGEHLRHLVADRTCPGFSALPGSWKIIAMWFAADLPHPSLGGCPAGRPSRVRSADTPGSRAPAHVGQRALTRPMPSHASHPTPVAIGAGRLGAERAPPAREDRPAARGIEPEERSSRHALPRAGLARPARASRPRRCRSSTPSTAWASPRFVGELHPEVLRRRAAGSRERWRRRPLPAGACPRSGSVIALPSSGRGRRGARRRRG